MSDLRLDTVADALADLAAGRPVIVLDDADRENEGDLILAAEHATPQWLAFFVRHGSGYVCAPLGDEDADRLELPHMVARNEDSMQTAFTVTVDAREGVTTGISAADRAHTLRLLADAATRADDLVRPGHVLPLRARAGGVLTRPGHTEAAVDLCRLAGLAPVGAIVELVEDDGTMRRADSCRALADAHGLRLITIADLVTHRRALGETPPAPARPAASAPTPAVQLGPSADLPTEHGTFRTRAVTDADGVDHLVLLKGTPGRGALVRVHSECLTGDAFGSLRCDCGPQLHAAMRAVDAAGTGMIVHVRNHEGRGIGLAPKIAAYALQDLGADTVEANRQLGLPDDARDYAVAAAVLAECGVDEIRLLTNNPAKIAALTRHGITVAERVPLVPTIEPRRYLSTKATRMGHLLPDLSSTDEHPTKETA